MYKKFEFGQYKKWRGLPAFLKGLSPDYLERGYSITDAQIVGLLQIRTQQDFARIYHVDQGTLSDWNERMRREDWQALSPETRRIINTTTKELLWALYVRILKYAKPKDVRFFLKLIDDSQTDSTVGHQTSGKITKRERNYLDKLFAKNKLGSSKH